jgi:hypothetical protein
MRNYDAEVICYFKIAEIIWTLNSYITNIFVILNIYLSVLKLCKSLYLSVKIK